VLLLRLKISILVCIEGKWFLVGTPPGSPGVRMWWRRGGELLEASELVKRYRLSSSAVTALDHCSLSVLAGEVVVLRGRSGSGKSTLLSVVAQLTKPDSGTVRLAGRSVTDLDEAGAADVRASSLGVVFQAFNLLPHLTAVQNVALPVRGPKRVGEARAMELLEEFGLADRRDHRPGELSGGEQQRIAIARALVNNPAVLVADEPTGNLDAENEDTVLGQLRRAADAGCAVLVASHSDAAASAADRVVRIDAGRIIGEGV
jgi:putative ABC transport system ATP-binding protein